jgi:uncharacterized membrane protein YuzA (DUF378 family)
MIFDGVAYDIPHKESGEKTKFAKIFEIVIGVSFVISLLAFFILSIIEKA